MPRIKEARLKANKTAKQLAQVIGTDEYMISKFENYKCLPVPEMLEDMCEELDCKRTDLYDTKELYIFEITKSSGIRAKAATEPEEYKLTVRLPREAMQHLTHENLLKCGYRSLVEFVWRSYLRYKKQLEIITAKEKRKSAALETATDCATGKPPYSTKRIHDINKKVKEEGI